MRGWFRFFGPPRIFLSDQEGALASDAFAALCDAFGIERWLAGSDPGNLGRGGKHTTTGLAEQAHRLVEACDAEDARGLHRGRRARNSRRMRG